MTTFERGPVLVAGGGGFLGGHLVRALLASGHREVRAVDVRPPQEWEQVHPAAQNVRLDLRDPDEAGRAARGMREIFNLAVRRGASTENVLMNTNLLLAADEEGVSRFTLASSVPESSATSWEPAAERTCQAFHAEFGLPTRVARLHPVYGPHDRRRGPDVRSPAALCRAALEAGGAGRPIVLAEGGHEAACFTYVDDAVEGLLRVHRCACPEPLEVGAREPVSTHVLARYIEELAGVRFRRTLSELGPPLATARASDLAPLLREVGWQPTTTLAVGLRRTFEWALAEHGASLSAPLGSMDRGGRGDRGD